MENIHKIRENIYITNDEEIKKEDWVLFIFNEVTEIVKVTTIVNNAFETKQGFGYGLEYCKKIILTTDQDLIKDGVQAIEEDFLNWFVKNPSCEEVDINIDFGVGLDISINFYKIIIPKEEPKQQTADEFAIGFADWIRVCKLKQRPYNFDNIKELLEIYKKEKGL